MYLWNLAEQEKPSSVLYLALLPGLSLWNSGCLWNSGWIARPSIPATTHFLTSLHTFYKICICWAPAPFESMATSHPLHWSTKIFGGPSSKTHTWGVRIWWHPQWECKGWWHARTPSGRSCQYAWSTLRAYSISQTETGSDQTLQTGLETVYCMKPRGWSPVIMYIFLLTNCCIFLL